MEATTIIHRDGDEPPAWVYGTVDEVQRLLDDASLDGRSGRSVPLEFRGPGGRVWAVAPGTVSGLEAGEDA